MGNVSNVSFRMDSELKKQADSLFEQLGMSMTTAFNIFLRQSVREGCIPFEVTTRTRPDAETVAALLEARKLMNDQDARTYTYEEAIRELNS